MSGQNQRSYGRLYRLWRKIRFLYKRGTLLRPAKPVSSIALSRKGKRRNSLRRTIRIIRFLYKKGGLFKTKSKVVNAINLMGEKPVQHNKRKSPSRIYIAYRKVRFLYRTGRLWLRKPPVKPKLKRRNQWLRKLVYLLKKGSLFKIKNSRAFAPDNISQEKLFQRKYLIIIVHSTGLFLLAYLVIYLVNSFITSLVAFSYDIQSIIYYSKTTFLINNYQWKYDPIIMVFSSGPFFSLLVSIIAIVIFNYNIERKKLVNLFLLWIFCHGFVHFFGEFFLGWILYKGFGYSLTYFFLGRREITMLILTFLSVGAIIVAGMLAANFFVFSGSYYFNRIGKNNRIPFLTSQFLIPSLLGTLLLALLKIPKIEMFEIYINLCILVIMTPVFMRSGSDQDFLFDEDYRRVAFNFYPVLLSIALLAIFRIVFEMGIRIG